MEAPMQPLIPSPQTRGQFATTPPGFVRLAAIASLLCIQWLAPNCAAQLQQVTLPLTFDQNAFLYRTFPSYSSNTAPLINCQSPHGVPISPNALDSGSDGRAPTVAQQISYGTNYPTASPSPGQFQGFVGIAAIPVQATTSLNTNVS